MNQFLVFEQCEKYLKLLFGQCQIEKFIELTFFLSEGGVAKLSILIDDLLACFEKLIIKDENRSEKFVQNIFLYELLSDDQIEPIQTFVYPGEAQDIGLHLH